ncbi:MAG TPA: Hsp70 family protein, partial [Cyclobacteriaceae bacterium]
GTSLMKQGTMVNGKAMRFDKIIAPFLKNIKDNVDRTAGTDVAHVVMGRPVHFIDNDPEGDQRAQEELKAIAQQIGFKHVEFQFEPIAAAFAHEVKIEGEKLAIVADLGGGTSDFTVIKLSNKFIHKADRASDILANTGVRVGGNDFDKELSLAAVMPEIGYQTTYGEKDLEVPPKPFKDLAEWSKVNFLYTTKIISQTRQILYQAHDKKRYQRLLQILEQETGHSLLAATEETKIALTSATDYHTPFDFIEEGLAVNIKRIQFEEAIREEVEKISRSATQCLQLAQVKSDDIDLVILTGGSTEVPIVQAEFKRLFPKAAIADENKLSSVGLGLAYDAKNKFGDA